MKVAITGAAGFIGMHSILQLQDRGCDVVWACDSLEPSYDSRLSMHRAEHLAPRVEIEQMDLAATDTRRIADRLAGADVLVHLAAWPGVRSGEDNRPGYLQNNVVAFQKVLDAVPGTRVKAVLFASSSSVYGDLATWGPCQEADAKPELIKSHYGLTKWMNELQAAQFNRRTGVATLGLRFFTVFGSWGRPDMLYWRFAEDLLRHRQSVSLFGADGGIRNYTSIADASAILNRLVHRAGSDGLHGAQIVNVAAGLPLSTRTFLEGLASALGVPMPPMEVVERPPSDAVATWADVAKLSHLIGDIEPTPVQEALGDFSTWLTRYLSR